LRHAAHSRVILVMTRECAAHRIMAKSNVGSGEPERDAVQVRGDHCGDDISQPLC
jgi:hypothetical protein